MPLPPPPFLSVLELQMVSEHTDHSEIVNRIALVTIRTSLVSTGSGSGSVVGNPTSGSAESKASSASSASSSVENSRKMHRLHSKLSIETRQGGAKNRCAHKKHNRMEALRTLILSDNELDRIHAYCPVNYQDSSSGMMPSSNLSSSRTDLSEHLSSSTPGVDNNQQPYWGHTDTQVW